MTTFSFASNGCNRERKATFTSAGSPRYKVSLIFAGSENGLHTYMHKILQQLLNIKMHTTKTIIRLVIMGFNFWLWVLSEKEYENEHLQEVAQRKYFMYVWRKSNTRCNWQNKSNLPVVVFTKNDNITPQIVQMRLCQKRACIYLLYYQFDW